jgi:hypothetical protein
MSSKHEQRQLGEVIERPEERNPIGGGIGVRKAARVADSGGSQ